MSNLSAFRITLSFSAPPAEGDTFTCIGHAGIERRWEIKVVNSETIAVKALSLPYYDTFNYHSNQH